MKNMELQKDVYEAPKCECLEMVNEGVLCTSDPQMQSSINGWEDRVFDNQSVTW